jgi:hypothetical protein
MLARARLLPFLCSLLPSLLVAQSSDPSYLLTAAGAEKFVRATQQMVASGAGPSLQGGDSNPLDLSQAKAEIDRNPAAQRALAAAGLSSAEYTSFMGAAMAAMMVGQMEAAGMRGFMPPGMTTRPPQPNIEFMRENVDLFQRATTPGAAASANPTARVAANTSDEALPMPAQAGSVWPSAILARLPRLDTINDSTDCTLGDLQAQIASEANNARALHDAYYGNPGNRGLARTPAERAVLERAGDTQLELCGAAINFIPGDAFAQADAARTRAMSEIDEERDEAWRACPGIPGGKEPAGVRAVNSAAARKTHDAERRYLQAVTQPFADTVARMQTCNAQRETIVRDAKAANVSGANVKDVLRPLVLAWELPPAATAQWTDICEIAQRYLIE